MYPTQRRGRIVIAPILIAAIFILVQYFGSESFTNPETGETVRVALNPEQENELGIQSFRSVLSQSKVIASGPEVDLVKRVVERLIPQVHEAARSYQWSAALIDSPDVNAFCLPGGKIAVYTGILPVTKNEAGLATVLAHEIAHATARHGAQRLFRERLIQTALQGFSGSLSDLDPGQRQIVIGLLGAGAQYGLVLPYGRDHELEADALGLNYMMKAGYDPREAISFWERMAEQGGRNPPEWASTHPSHGSRIERIKEIISQQKAP